MSRSILSSSKQLSRRAGNDRREIPFWLWPWETRLILYLQYGKTPCRRSRVQFFMWLASKGRIQCRQNLLGKKIVNNPNMSSLWKLKEGNGSYPASLQFCKSVLECGQSTSCRWRLDSEYGKPAQDPCSTAASSPSVAANCGSVAMHSSSETRAQAGAASMHCLDAEAWRPIIPRKQRYVTDAWC